MSLQTWQHTAMNPLWSADVERRGELLAEADTAGCREQVRLALLAGPDVHGEHTTEADAAALDQMHARLASERAGLTGAQLAARLLADVARLYPPQAAA